MKDNQPRPQGNVVLQRNSEYCYHWKGEETLVLQKNANKLPMTCFSLTDCCQSPPSLFLSILGPLTVSHMCPVHSRPSCFCKCYFLCLEGMEGYVLFLFTTPAEISSLRRNLLTSVLQVDFFPPLCLYHTYHLPTLL